MPRSDPDRFGTASDEARAWRAGARLTPASFFPPPRRRDSAMPRGAHLLVTLAALAVMAAGTTALMLQQRTPYSQNRVGGPFAMTDADGRRVTQADLTGRPSVLYFGYTSCPDLCPTSLSLLAGAMGRMGAGADRFNAVFVTVDPARDTPTALKDYLGSFDRRIRGFTGTEAEVAAMVDTFHVVRRRGAAAGGEGGYEVAHSADALLLNAAGRVVGKIYYGEDEDSILAKLTTLAPEPVCRPGAPGPADLWAPSATLGPGQLCRTG